MTKGRGEAGQLTAYGEGLVGLNWCQKTRELMQEYKCIIA